MTRRLLATYVGLTAIVILALGIPLAIAYQHDAQHDRTLQVQAGTAALATLVDDSAEHSVSLTAPVLAGKYAQQLQAHVIILSPRHTILASAGGGRVAPYASIPQHARAGQITTGSLGGRLYVIASTAGGGHVLAIYSEVGVNGAVRHYWLLIGLFSGAALLVATGVGLMLARGLTRPLRQLERATVAVGEGQPAPVAESGPPEVRSLARSFNEATRRLNHLLDAQAAWVSDASHELRTPLSAMRLRLENAQARRAPDEDIDAALADVDRLTGLTDDLLALSRVDGSHDTPVTIDLERVVADRVALWSPLAEEQGVALITHIQGHPVVNASAGTLEQALDNLLANAFEVSPASSHITISAYPEGETVLLHVIDDGPGLSEEERARAFDRFWRGSTARSGAGSGLGLAIVRALVERDHGTVTLKPSSTGGIDAAVRLPRVTAMSTVE